MTVIWNLQIPNCREFLMGAGESVLLDSDGDIIEYVKEKGIRTDN